MGALSIEQWRARIGGFKPPGPSTPMNKSVSAVSKGRRSRIKISLIMIALLVYADVSYRAESTPINMPASTDKFSVNGNFLYMF